MELQTLYAVRSSSDQNGIEQLSNGNLDGFEFGVSNAAAYTSPATYTGACKLTLADGSSQYGHWVTYYFRDPILPSAVEIIVVPDSNHAFPTKVSVLGGNAMFDGSGVLYTEHGSGLAALVTDHSLNFLPAAAYSYRRQVVPVLTPTAYKVVTVLFTGISDPTKMLGVNELRVLCQPADEKVLQDKFDSLGSSFATLQTKVVSLEAALSGVGVKVSAVEAAVQNVFTTVKSLDDRVQRPDPTTENNAPDNTLPIVGVALSAFGSVALVCLIYLAIIINRKVPQNA